jgi:hypothetical protein
MTYNQADNILQDKPPDALESHRRQISSPLWAGGPVNYDGIPAIL